MSGSYRPTFQDACFLFSQDSFKEEAAGSFSLKGQGAVSCMLDWERDDVVERNKAGDDVSGEGDCIPKRPEQICLAGTQCHYHSCSRLSLPVRNFPGQLKFVFPSWRVHWKCVWTYFPKATLCHWLPSFPQTQSSSFLILPARSAVLLLFRKPLRSLRDLKAAG